MKTPIIYYPPTADCDINSIVCKKCGALPGEGCKSKEK